MTPFWTIAGTALAAYLIGAVPFGYLIARARGVDIFQAGSGNIGATNVGRVLGRRFGILVFLLDFAKGAGPVAAAQQLALYGETWPLADALPVVAGLAAFLGHLFPVYLGFRGGKGVATGAGVVAVLVPLPALAALLTWVAVVCATRTVSLASLAAAAALCLFQLMIAVSRPGEADVIITVFCFVAAGLVVARHRANIGRLRHGTENRLKETSTMLILIKTVHVLALGLWFGSVIFFTFVVGLSLFRTFEEWSNRPAAERPLWLPLPSEYAKERPSPQFSDPLRKEQGSRVAGAAVGPMFTAYFAIQAVCGLLALATAYSFCATVSSGAVDKVRLVVVLFGMVSVAAGWWLERAVEARRVPRNELTDAVLKSTAPTAEEVQQASAARADFGRWHLYSLMVNFLTLILVTIAMALAAQLPAAAGETQPAPAIKQQEAAATS
jgi:acyl phosphate:glycerol-3-phosphate acyltransferase